MVKLIFDDWQWRCENCKSPMSLPGIAPDIETLKRKGWKYCPVCGKRIDYKATAGKGEPGCPTETRLSKQ